MNGSRNEHAAAAVNGRGVRDSGERPYREFNSNRADVVRNLQFRLAAVVLAVEAVLVDLPYMEMAVELTARGLPLPSGGQIRLHRLAVKLFDFRAVLEEPMPEANR